MNSLECKQFLEPRLPTRLESCLICENGEFCTGPEFARQEWVHEVALPMKVSSHIK
jgi:hypothetical protein